MPLYDINFVERTFRTRAATEALLAPEREHGLLTLHDYTAAVDFFPAFHRQYSTVGGVMGFMAGYGLSVYTRKKGIFLYLTLGSVIGHQVGTFMNAWSHFKFIQKIEEREQFSQAMANVKQRQMQTVPGRAAASTPNKEDVHPDETLTSQPQSSWDRIRTANSKGAQQSSWDSIRQAHEKAQIQKRPELRSGGRFVDDDDQAMEREPN